MATIYAPLFKRSYDVYGSTPAPAASLAVGRGIGNSLVKGYNSATQADDSQFSYATYATQDYQNSTTYYHTFDVFALSGKTAGEILAYVQVNASTVFAKPAGFKRYVVVIGEMAVNSLMNVVGNGGRGQSVSDTFRDVKALHQLAQSYGWLTIATTTLANGKEYGVGVAAGKVLFKEYDDRVKAYWKSDLNASGFLDYTADSIFGYHADGQAYDQTYYQGDNQHPSAAGAAYIWSLNKPAFEAVAAGNSYGVVTPFASSGDLIFSPAYPEVSYNAGTHQYTTTATDGNFGHLGVASVMRAAGTRAAIVLQRASSSDGYGLLGFKSGNGLAGYGRFTAGFGIDPSGNIAPIENGQLKAPIGILPVGSYLRLSVLANDTLLLEQSPNGTNNWTATSTQLSSTLRVSGEANIGLDMRSDGRLTAARWEGCVPATAPIVATRYSRLFGSLVAGPFDGQDGWHNPAGGATISTAGLQLSSSEQFNSSAFGCVYDALSFGDGEVVAYVPADGGQVMVCLNADPTTGRCYAVWNNAGSLDAGIIQFNGSPVNTPFAGNPAAGQIGNTTASSYYLSLLRKTDAGGTRTLEIRFWPSTADRPDGAAYTHICTSSELLADGYVSLRGLAPAKFLGLDIY